MATPFAAERAHLDSRLKDFDIVIDGDNRDWAGPLAIRVSAIAVPPAGSSPVLCGGIL